MALTVPEPWGDELQEQRAAYGDRLAWTIPTHITLLPPTQVSASDSDRSTSTWRRSRRIRAFELQLGPAADVPAGDANGVSERWATGSRRASV